MPTQPSATLDVLVLDYTGDVISDASVRLRPQDNGTRQIVIPFDEGTRRYHIEGLEPGPCTLSVEHPSLSADERQVAIVTSSLHETFVLGHPGMLSYRRGGVNMPFEPRTDMVGVTLRGDVSGADADQAVDDIMRLTLTEMPVQDNVRAQHTRVFGLTADSADLDTVVAELSRRPDVERAGAVLHYDENSVTYLTDELVVKFTDDVTEERANELLEEADLEVMRQIPYSGNTYQVRRPGPASYALLDAASRLNDLNEVEWAEPNVAGAFELDAVKPADFLADGLWDRNLAGLPKAWQWLHDAGLQQFGEPTVIIADVDQGIASSSGVASHPEFQGAVSNGQPKIYGLYDFRTLTPNNDTPMGDHGMGTAGVATARADNPSPVAGVTEGLAGAAPNCRVMGLIFPSTEVDIADMYIWAAGFNPNSPRAGFPAQISPGADIFTTSIGFGAGAVLSGVAKAMLDYITTYGRNGKGCLAFFSAGNGNQNVTTVRPYAGYERSFGTAATTLADDGVTEIRAPYSGWGPVEVCAPSHDEFVNGIPIHNPPAHFAPWSCHLPGEGNLMGHPTHTTSLTAPAAAGATSIRVASVTGISNGDWLLIRNPGVLGGEPVQVTGVPDPATGQVPCTGLLNAHPVGEPVRRGPTGYRNNFGGTSSATPLAAGCAALLLSAEPDLTWVEVRELIRNTSAKFDLANTDPVGRWLDRNGQPISASGQPAYFSQWYGHGRIDADAAVKQALVYDFARDLMVRDNLADVGSQPSTGAFWNSPDIWVRTKPPQQDGAAALPANYATAGPHQAPVSGQDNYIYVRVRNRGSQPSYDAYLRVYLVHWPGLEFSYPDSFIPTNRPGQVVPSPLTQGTYLIGEQKLSGLGAGADITLNVRWPKEMVPPQTVTIGGIGVTWHPCLLVEVSPQDGPPATGNRVWDRNNLAQKNITIVYADLHKLFASALVVGHLFSATRQAFLEIDRGDLPATVKLHLDLVDPKLTAFVKDYIRRTRPVPVAPVRPERPVIPVQPGIRALRDIQPGGEPGLEDAEYAEVPLALATAYRYRDGSAGNQPGEPAAPIGPGPVIPPPVRLRPREPEIEMGHVRGREVVRLVGRGKVTVPIGPVDRPLGPILIGGVADALASQRSCQIVVTQRDQAGRRVGAAGVQIRFVTTDGDSAVTEPVAGP